MAKMRNFISQNGLIGSFSEFDDPNLSTFARDRTMRFGGEDRSKALVPLRLKRFGAKAPIMASALRPIVTLS